MKTQVTSVRKFGKNTVVRAAGGSFTDIMKAMGKEVEKVINETGSFATVTFFAPHPKTMMDGDKEVEATEIKARIVPKRVYHKRS